MIKHWQEEGSALPRVVVLGGSGFVGRDLTNHLRDRKIETVTVSSAEIDLRRPEAVEQLRQVVRKGDALVIVSAITPDKGKDTRTLMLNLQMGEHISQFLAEDLCSHVVYVSSDAVYADDANPVRETSCCDPSSFHGLMHLVRERMFSFALQKSGIPFMIVRPCAIYGAGDTHNSYGPNRFLRNAQAGTTLALFGQGEEKRDHVHIRDVSRFIGLCLAHRSAGVLNVATGSSFSFFDVATMVASLCGNGVKIEGSARTNPITHRHFDIALAMKTFPSFRYVPLAEGLSKTLENMQGGWN